ncbi:peptidase inhibitor family I36 protein [Amycolatopsis sp. NBC_00355]|uniref:peptidase inhibitor family I36 protein n=1 Tax=Amycolatopsis sp. NBC_00355 TaxID=2975957 RepID=UPI002E261502
MGTLGRRVGTAALAIGSAITVLAAVAPAASAAPVRNGKCEAGEFCLYYEYDLQGSVSDFTTSIPNYGSSQPDCYEFKGPGTGQHACVKNRALSGYNRTSHVVRLYFNSNYKGTYIDFAPDDARDGGLGPLDLNNASHQIR